MKHISGVPTKYSEAWQQLQIQKPVTVTSDEWRQALSDGLIFLLQHGKVIEPLGWLPGALFDVPRRGCAGGLIWALQGRRIESINPNLPADQQMIG